MEASTIETGMIVDRYTVEGVLGEGGMAMVFRVRHNQLGTTHALKVLMVPSRTVRERLIQEGQLQATLRHDNIVAVTDLISLDGDVPGLIMEFIDGPNLEDVLFRREANLDQVDHLARGILAGVGHAHAEGLIHRDLKPANILLHPISGGWIPKVADFGLAKILAGGDSLGAPTRTGATMGTPQYMSPEQVRDTKHVGTPGDVFALGAILYEMVTHERAFDGEDMLEVFNAVASGEFRPVREFVPTLPDRMEAAIVAALQVDPEARPQTATELAEIWNDGSGSDVILSAYRGPPLPPDRLRESATWTPELNPASTMGGPANPPSAPTLPGAAVAIASLGGGALLLAAALGLVAIMVAVGLLWFAVPEGPGGGSKVQTIAPSPTPRLDVIPEATPPPDEAGDDAPAEAKGAPPAPVGAKSSGPVAPAPVGAKSSGAVAPAPVPAPFAVTVPADPMDEMAWQATPEVGIPNPPSPDLAPPPSPAPVVAAAPQASGTSVEYGQMLSSDDPAERKKGVDNLAATHFVREADLLLAKVVQDGRDPKLQRHAWRAVHTRWKRQEASDATILEATAAWVIANGASSDAVQAAKDIGSWGKDAASVAPGLAHPRLDVVEASLEAARQLQARGVGLGSLGPALEKLAASGNVEIASQAAALLR